MGEGFKCSGCGKCCSKFGDKHYLPLYDWEVEVLLKEAKEKNIKINIKPLKYFLDKKSGIIVVFLYGMFNEPCVFLENNHCSIYKNRPSICKKFPLGYTPRMCPKMFNLDCFYICPEFNARKFMASVLNLKEEELETKGKEPTKLNTATTDPIFKAFFGEIFDYCTQENMAEMYIGKSIQMLKEKNLIKLRKVSEFDLNKHKQMNLFDFMIMKGMMNEKSKEFLIKSVTEEDFIENVKRDIE